MRGGKRPGAGRKKGTQNKRTKDRQKVAERALKEGITPLDVMLMAMREAYRTGGATAASQYAKEAAPYVHPRLSAIAAKIGESFNPWEELLRFVDGTPRKLPGSAGSGEKAGD